MAKLLKYQKWRIAELGDYSGPMNHQVFTYLDTLKQPEYTSVREDLGYLQLEHKPSNEIAKDCMAHIKTLFDDRFTEKQKNEIEKEFIIEMRSKYPAYNWHGGRKANQHV